MSKNYRYGIIAAGIAIIILVVATVVIGLLDARARTTPQEAVDRFYATWTQAMARGGEGPVVQRLHHKSTYVTEEFARTVDRNAENGKDAVLCTGTMPTSFTSEPGTVASNDLTASVKFQTESVVGHVVLVRDEQGWWRIDEVDCP